MSELEGKVALVTGAASGIGRASALLMASRGAAVVVTDLVASAAEDLAHDIQAEGGTARAIKCDIGVEAEIKDAVRLAVSEFGRLNIMFNNAALMEPEVLGADKDILSIDFGAWDRTMNVTLRGTMLGCHYGARAMVETGGGSIINTSSVFGLRGHVDNMAYGVAKGAINTLTKFVATALGRQGVRCNAVAPSLITTTAARHIPENLKKVHIDNSLAGRLGAPEDVAEVVAFLASDRSRFITGYVLPVDGGTLAHYPIYAGWREELAYAP